ncbi:hypothetical protein H6G27_24070 [Nostoc linckia FACHB-104]|nr:hypothetical protein [Nostoc linckia FACHB-104]
MPLSKRLADLEKILELRYETLSKAGKRLAITDEIFAKNAIEQRIREEILPEIRQYETEYWQLLAQEANFCTVEEVDAHNAIFLVVQKIELMEKNSSANYPNDLMRLLLEIRDKLNQPGTPAAAKAKIALPLLPGILSYEVELDTENALRQAFQPLKQLFKKAEENKKAEKK